MLKIVNNLLENLLILVNITKKDKRISKNIFIKINKNLSKFQRLKKLKIVKDQKFEENFLSFNISYICF